MMKNVNDYLRAAEAAIANSDVALAQAYATMALAAAQRDA